MRPSYTKKEFNNLPNFMPLTTTDVAIALDTNPDEIAMLIRKGLIKARKKGKLWRIKKRGKVG